MEHRMRLTGNLRRLRKQRGWSQDTLAFYAGLHPTEVSRLERGVREPRLSTILQLAEALDVPVDSLLEPAEAQGETLAEGLPFVHTK